MSDTTVLPLHSIRTLLDKLRPEITGKTLSRLTAMLDVMSPAGSLSLERALQVTFDHIPAEGRLKQFTNFLSDINAGLKAAGLDDTIIVVVGGKFDHASQRTVVFHGPDSTANDTEALSGDVAATHFIGHSVENPIGTTDAKPRLRGFVVYAHADAKAVARLLGYMEPHLTGSDLFQFELWQDKNKIELGDNWRAAIQAGLANSDFGIFMVSQPFLNSAFITETETEHFKAFAKPFCMCMVGNLAKGRFERSHLGPFQGFLFGHDAEGFGRPFEQLTTERGQKSFALSFAEAIEKSLTAHLGSPVQPKIEPASSDDFTTAPEIPGGFIPNTWTHLPMDKGDDDHDTRTYVPELTPAIRAAFTALGLDSEAPCPPSVGEFRAIHYLAAWVLDPTAPPYFALFGEYGVGKTTNLAKLAILFRDARKHTPSLPRVIYLDLRNSRGKNVADAPIALPAILDSIILDTWQSDASKRVTADDIIRAVRDHAAVVLFDGLDERAVHYQTPQVQQFIRQLWSIRPRPELDARTGLPLPHKGAGNPGKVLISCRSHYFREVRDQYHAFTGKDNKDMPAACYASCIVLPFGEAQIREYLGKVLGPERIEHTMSLLGEIHNLRELAERPVLLNLITEQIGKLERDKARGRIIRAATLYDNLISDWLYRDEGKERFSHRHKVLLTEDLSAALWRSGKKEWPADKLEEWLDKWLLANPEINAAYPQDTRLQLYRDLFTATFLVRPGDAGSQFRFAHTSFQEYFLARYLYRALATIVAGPSRPLLRAPSDDSFGVEGAGTAPLLQREAWAMNEPSLETFDFLGDLLVLRDDAALALKGLAALLETNTPQATRNAFRYWVRAMEKDAPQPQPTRVALAREDLSGWRVGVQRRRDFQSRSGDSPASGSHALEGASQQDSEEARLAEVAQARLEISPTLRIPSLDLTGANLTRSQWQHIAMPKVNLTGVRAEGALFRNCDLTEAIWEKADFAEIDLIHTTGLPEPLPAALKAAWCVPGNTAAFAKKPRTLQGVGHAPFQWACAWSPDGTQVLSASFDHTLRVWDPRSGKVLHVLHGHTGLVRGCAWSPDGTQVLSASDDNTLRVWEPRSGKVLHVLQGHTGEVRGCAWSPDGTQVLSASGDKTLRVWEPRTGKVLHVLCGHTGEVNGCAWSPDGTLVLSASDDDTLRVWEPRNGNVLHVMHGLTGTVWGCAWSPNGRAVLSALLDGTLRIWDMATQRPTLALLTPWNAPGAAVDLTRSVLITDAGDAWRNWRWKVKGAPSTLPLEAFTAP